MAIFVNNGTEVCWVDGAPVGGLPKMETSPNIGKETFWADGTPVQTLFSTVPVSNFLAFFG